MAVRIVSETGESLSQDTIYQWLMSCVEAQNTKIKLLNEASSDIAELEKAEQVKESLIEALRETGKNITQA
jgi:hypothetical protein